MWLENCTEAGDARPEGLPDRKAGDHPTNGQYQPRQSTIILGPMSEIGRLYGVIAVLVLIVAGLAIITTVIS
jgi:hypothetical protein